MRQKKEHKKSADAILRYTLYMPKIMIRGLWRMEVVLKLVQYGCVTNHIDMKNFYFYLL